VPSIKYPQKEKKERKVEKRGSKTQLTCKVSPASLPKPKPKKDYKKLKAEMTTKAQTSRATRKKESAKT